MFNFASFETAVDSKSNKDGTNTTKYDPKPGKVRSISRVSICTSSTAITKLDWFDVVFCSDVATSAKVILRRVPCRLKSLPGLHVGICTSSIEHNSVRRGSSAQVYLR